MDSKLLEPQKGFVHSIETFGTVDGPGIRFVLFLQGCPLHCKYCHNRDTWKTNCGTIYNVEDLLLEVKKYKNYILPSGGGITVSGGEPLLQAEFVTTFFKRLKQNNFHTALDTAGSLPIDDNIKELLDYTDLVLLDIKHIDNKECINLTGSPNTNTLNFAKYLSSINKSMWIRQVLIPGITDKKEHLKDLSNFISTLNNVQKVEILPYHTLGVDKWKSIGVKYQLEDIPPATQQDVIRAKKIMNLE